MATPAITVDGTTVFKAAEMNKYISSDGTAIQVKIWHARIRYNGSALVVESAVDSAGITTGALNFNATDETIEITLSGFTNAPVIVATAQGTSAYYPKVFSTTNTLAALSFHDINTGALITAGIDTNYDAHVMIIGF